MAENSLIILQTLEAYGLNKKQAKLYLACLGLGLSTVRDLSKKAKIKRTTIYSLLEDLEDKGAINIVKQKKKTYVSPVRPDLLLKNFEERREKILKNLHYFKDIEEHPASGPKLIFYRGGEGFKNFWRDILNSGTKEWLITTSGKEFLSFVSESYIKNKIIKEKNRLGIKSRQIITNSVYAREIIKDDAKENRESRLVDFRFPLPANEIVFGDRVAIISSNFENLLVVIESKEIAETHRSYFEIMWQSVKSVGESRFTN